MRYLPRLLEPRVRAAFRAFPCVVLTGPRRAGKTWLLQRLFRGATYRLLEDPDLIARVRADPHAFLDDLRPPVVLDEVQHVPELLPYIRARIDRHPRRCGQWVLTGSQDFAMMQGVTESMAGRAAILRLLPMSARESPKVSVIRGGYPEVLARPAAADLWFSSYIQTYLERDVRSVTAVRDLSTFRRFLSILASRHGQLLNKSDIAGPLGVSVPTVTQWLGVLETTSQVIVVPPYFENFGKRLVKSAKVYFTDSGLLCHLLGLASARDLAASPFAGPVFEGFVASEIVKSQVNEGRRGEIYHFRDEQGLEVDFVAPGRDGRPWLVECKASATVTPAMARPVSRLAEALRARPSSRAKARSFVVFQPRSGSVQTPAIAPGVEAVSWRSFCERIAARP